MKSSQQNDHAGLYLAIMVIAIIILTILALLATLRII